MKKSEAEKKTQRSRRKVKIAQCYRTIGYKVFKKGKMINNDQL